MPFPLEVKAEALIACGRRCCICQKPCGVRMECHHIVPEAKGGPDTLENCIPLCFDCHAEVGYYNAQHPKGNKFSPEELRGHRDNLHRMRREAMMAALEEPQPEKPPGIVLVPPPTTSQRRKIQPAKAIKRKVEREFTAQEIKILAFLADEEASEWSIAQETGLSPARIKFHLTELEAEGFVSFCFAGVGDGVWETTHEVRRYLMERNLLD